MRKVFKLDEIDCAVCAGKLEDAIKKLDGVQDAKINFLTQKLTLEAADEDFNAVLDAVVDFTAEVEPDCEIYAKTRTLHDARRRRRANRAVAKRPPSPHRHP